MCHAALGGILAPTGSIEVSCSSTELHGYALGEKGSNLQHTDSESGVLPIELPPTVVAQTGFEPVSPAYETGEMTNYSTALLVDACYALCL